LLVAFGLLMSSGLVAATLSAVKSVIPESAATPIPPRAEMGKFTDAAAPRALPPLRFIDSSGRAMSLENFRGRVILLNLWATWCGPCVKEMPALDRLQTELGSPAFQVVPLSVDRDGAATVIPFLEKLGIRSLVPYLDIKGSSLKLLGTQGLPTTLLIDRDGREVARMLGGAEWDSPAVRGIIRRLIEAPAKPGPTTSGT
jgi:thiol-disulfide isomerase/thioredoxin